MGRLDRVVPFRCRRARRRRARVALSLWAVVHPRLARLVMSALLWAPALATLVVLFRLRPARPQPVQVVACYSLPEMAKQLVESCHSLRVAQQQEQAVK